MHDSPVRALFLACALSLAIAAAPPAAGARDDTRREHGPFVNAGAMLCTIVYSPLKISYAVTGATLGGLVWLWSFGNKRVARPIFRRALRGDYVVTPEHLTGEHRLKFKGRY